MAKRKCTNVACGFNGLEVDTEVKNCIGCGKTLRGTTLFDDLADGMDTSDLGDLFGGLFKK